MRAVVVVPQRSIQEIDVIVHSATTVSQSFFQHVSCVERAMTAMAGVQLSRRLFNKGQPTVPIVGEKERRP